MFPPHSSTLRLFAGAQSTPVRVWHADLMQPVNMASSQVRELTVCLLVLYSLVVLAEGLAGPGGGSREGPRARVSSESGSGDLLTTPQSVGILCGLLGGPVAIFVIVILVRRFRPKREKSSSTSKQVVKHNPEDAVLTSPPCYSDEMSDQSENWKVISPQLKLTPCEPTTVNNVKR